MKDSPSQQKPVDSKYEYKQTGGCRFGESYHFGSWNVTWPFASLRLSDNSLSVSIVLGRVFEFTPKDVVVIRKFFGLFSWGVQIEHTKPEYPACIVFWTFKRWELLQMLQRAGFAAETP